MARRGENIRKRKDGRWEGRYIKARTSEGKIQWGYVYGTVYAEVKRVLIQKKAEAGFYKLKRTDLTFEALAEVWLYSLRNSIKESTYAHYSYTLHKYLLPVLSKVPVVSLDESFLEQAMQQIIAPTDAAHKKDFAIITNVNDKFLNELEEKLHFKGDKRIKFVGTVYDQELLKKIRENAYAYFHGHTVGGTNPSLIEALGSTDLNLLVDVGFNKEVAEDCALYWSRKPGSLAKLINKADQMSVDEIAEMGRRAKKRVAEEYTWDKICRQYENVFVRK